MARIRSVHPGLFTDEAFMDLSSDAQIFLIGLWTEADDQGIFEWKPSTLRARLRPTKDGPVDGLLAELEAGNCICSYEIGGRKFGAVRNFRKYQRPKKPNSVHPITAEIGTYTFLSASGTELDDDEPEPSSEPKPVKPTPVPPKSEISPQMKDGGGRMEDEGDSPSLREGSSAPSAKPSSDDSPAFIALDTNVQGQSFIVTEQQVADFKELYPAVDVEQQLRNIRGWLLTNRGKRKTRPGMPRFINSWLAREQDKGHVNGTSGSNHNGKTGKPANHQNHLEGLARLVDDDDRRAASVQERGPLALTASDDGKPASSDNGPH